MSNSDVTTIADLSSAEAISSLLSICFPDASSVFDPTYGNGKFWPDKPPGLGLLSSDINPSRAPHFCADFTSLPLRDRSFDVTIFDPPFQPATVDGIIGRRFSKPVKGVDALKQLVLSGASESARVSRLGIIVKCQDYIHDHKPVWMSFWLYELMGEPYEFMHLRVKSKLKASNWGAQKSVYRNHSTFWVWRWAPKVR